MKLDQFNSKTIQKIQKYMNNKNGAFSGMTQLINEKNSKISILKAQLEQEEENYLVDFDPAVRQNITELKTEIASLEKELKEDLQFQQKAQQRTLVLTKDDYSELKANFDKVTVKQNKLYQEVLKKKEELLSAFLKFNEEYAEIHKLHYEIEWAIKHSLGDDEWLRNVSKLLNHITKADIMEQGEELQALFYSAPIHIHKGGTMIKAKQQFAAFSDIGIMEKGQYKMMKSEEKPLMENWVKSGIIEKVKY